MSTEKTLTLTVLLSTTHGQSSEAGDIWADELLENLKLQLSKYVASKGEGQLAVTSVVES
jgi:hypothetical protein